MMIRILFPYNHVILPSNRHHTTGRMYLDSRHPCCTFRNSSSSSSSIGGRYIRNQRLQSPEERTTSIRFKEGTFIHHNSSNSNSSSNNNKFNNHPIQTTQNFSTHFNEIIRKPLLWTRVFLFVGCNRAVQHRFQHILVTTVSHNKTEKMQKNQRGNPPKRGNDRGTDDPFRHVRKTPRTRRLANETIRTFGGSTKCSKRLPSKALKKQYPGSPTGGPLRFTKRRNSARRSCPCISIPPR
mmetsp:Transcript_16914/g.42259  ORF Transcript_16914/g.42259 Transcript_16914/m.42259 type:complete len:239 (-) Transcript_16914:503-1219(-)